LHGAILKAPKIENVGKKASQKKAKKKTGMGRKKQVGGTEMSID